MGVTNLWTILAPVAEEKPIETLKGKKIAVDLSGWVCESQTSKIAQIMRKPHIRNLFYKTLHLLQLGVQLVFVTEGDVPSLKAETMEKRLLSRGEHYNSTEISDTEVVKNKCSRKHFERSLKECHKLLASLGVLCIQASGEAEATCAYLNKMKFVDACLTSDGDIFLYGARTVFRFFSTNDNIVSLYRMDRIESELGLTRQNLVAFALLVGCDYDTVGVPGVGQAKAVKLLQKFSQNGHDPIQRFKSWKSMEFPTNDLTLKKFTHCNSCCHPVSIKEHRNGGCIMCQTVNGCKVTEANYVCNCSWHNNIEEFSLEWLVKEKAAVVSNFPNEKIINEFMTDKENFQVFAVDWCQPNIEKFQQHMIEFLNWTAETSLEKIIPLVTMWQMHSILAGKKTKFLLEPREVKKKKKLNHKQCYEISWYQVNSSPEIFHVTVEEQAVFSKVYPQITEIYEHSKQKSTMMAYLNMPKARRAEISRTPSKIMSTKIKRPKIHKSPVNENSRSLIKEMFLKQSIKSKPSSSRSATPNLICDLKNEPINLDLSQDHSEEDKNKGEAIVISDDDSLSSQNEDSPLPLRQRLLQKMMQ